MERITPTGEPRRRPGSAGSARQPAPLGFKTGIMSERPVAVAVPRAQPEMIGPEETDGPEFAQQKETAHRGRST